MDKVDIWLEHAPATTAWLADVLGKGLPGVQTVETWWQEKWLPTTSPPLGAEIVLAGRKSQSEELIGRLADKVKTVTLSGELRPEEARAFCAAALLTFSPTLADRCLLVSNADSLSILQRQVNPLILLVTEIALAGNLSQNSPHQLILLDRVGASEQISVPPVDGLAVAVTLETLGVGRDRATDLGALARRSLLAAQRALAPTTVMLTPTWAISADVVHRRLLLLGAWNEENESDRQIIADCVGIGYDDLQERALAIARTAEMPFLANLGDTWHVIAPEDSWILLGRSMTRDDLMNFNRSALSVLSEVDPRLQLPSSDRWQAGLRGIRRQHSTSLRQAVARTLGVLATDPSGRTIGNRTPPQWATIIVREVLEWAGNFTSYEGWSSITDVLPQLAQTAPRVFTEAVGAGLVGELATHRQMFQDGKPTGLLGSGSSPHLAFLSALEDIAWSTEYFDDAVDILAQLATLDPEPPGGWANRPINSLAAIFDLFRPSTSARNPQRVRALERILRTWPEVGRRLIMLIVGDQAPLGLIHTRPLIHPWREDRILPTGVEVEQYSDLLMNLLLDDIDSEGRRIIDLIGIAGSMSNTHRGVLAQKIAEIQAVISEDVERARIFDAISAFVAKHREYSDAAWSIPEEQLIILESSARHFMPENPVLRHRWLFADVLVTLGDQSRRDNFDEYERVMSARRAAAIGDVLEEGVANLSELARLTDHPELVGTALSSHTSELDKQMIEWLELDSNPESQIAFFYLSGRMRDGDSSAVCADLLAMTANALAQARVLRASYDPINAWACLEGLSDEVKECYWREFSYLGLGSSFDGTLHAAEELIGVRRYAAALRLLSLHNKTSQGAESAHLAARAFEALIANGVDDAEFAGIAEWDYERLFNLLGEHREEVGDLRVIHIEWQFFPMLGWRADAPTLHQAISREPVLFSELAAHAFGSDEVDAHSGGEGADRRDRATALRAYEVLQSWSRCPGVDEGGGVDGVALAAWVNSAMALLAQNGILDQGSREIGRVLMSALADSDGTHPPRAILDLLERLRSPAIESGMRCALLNSNGMSSRGLLDGGERERALAQAFHARAEAVQDWPRMRRVFEDAAEFFESDARRHDMSAERRRRDIDYR